jgi:hypothetical protein
MQYDGIRERLCIVAAALDIPAAEIDPLIKATDRQMASGRWLSAFLALARRHGVNLKDVLEGDIAGLIRMAARLRCISEAA